MNAYAYDRFYGDIITQPDRFTDEDEPIIDILERRGISYYRYWGRISAYLNGEEDAVDVTEIETEAELEDLIEEVTA